MASVLAPRKSLHGSNSKTSSLFPGVGPGNPPYSAHFSELEVLKTGQ